MGEIVHLSLGSNLGNREDFIQKALAQIEAKIAPLAKVSHFYESEPWGFETTSQFLNICASLETDRDPNSLLQTFQMIEKALGREEKIAEGYASRVIDIDILTYGDKVVISDDLVLPHPEMKNRKFVLLPLLEIAPEFTHPKSAKTIQQILADCRDKSSVIIYENK